MKITKGQLRRIILEEASQTSRRKSLKESSLRPYEDEKTDLLIDAANAIYDLDERRLQQIIDKFKTLMNYAKAFKGPTEREAYIDVLEAAREAIRLVR